MYKIICLKKVSLIKNIWINLFEKMNNLIAQDLLSIVNYIKVNSRYKNEKKYILIN